jgi:hypothetical protein
LWSWIGVAVVGVIVLIVTTTRLVKRQYESAHERSIKRLLDSSHRLEMNGRVSEALVDLDAALLLIDQADSKVKITADSPRKHRQTLARKDAEAVRDKLLASTTNAFPLGEWLGLLERTRQDADLASLRSNVEEQFVAHLNREVASQLDTARSAISAQQPLQAVNICEQIVRLLANLPPDIRQPYRTEADRLVSDLIQHRGVLLEMPRGEFIQGTQNAYATELLPSIERALESKGYLPNRAASPFKQLWNASLYQLDVEIIEKREGNYLSTENRLTRIEARLRLSSRGEPVWQTMPTSRSSVPLPHLPAYQASRLAVNNGRSEELENLLYTDARGQIADKLGFALQHLPAFH